MAVCLSCRAELRQGALFCTQCGDPAPKLLPQLELFDFRPWFPAGAYTSFGLRIKPQLPDIARVQIWLEGTLAKQGDRQLELNKMADGSFEQSFECLAPSQGGTFRTGFLVECVDSNGLRSRFRGTTHIPLIGNNWQEDVIRRNLQGLVVELRNKGGVLRQEGQIATPIDRLILDNEDGITRVMGNIESGSVLSWMVQLSPQGACLGAEPHRTDNGCLQFLSGSNTQYTRIFAKERLVLGRYQTAADLWLTLFPQSDPTQQSLMQRISAEHVLIRRAVRGWEIQDRSRWGTWLNNNRLGSDWRDLGEKDRLRFLAQGPLTLEVHLRPGGGLHLERVGNGAAMEDYLLLPPDTRGTETGPRPHLSHENGGLLLHPQREGGLINNKPMTRGIATGLRDGDRVECEEMAFFYRKVAYPAVSDRAEESP